MTAPFSSLILVVVSPRNSEVARLAHVSRNHTGTTQQQYNTNGRREEKQQMQRQERRTARQTFPQRSTLNFIQHISDRNMHIDHSLTLSISIIIMCCILFSFSFFSSLDKRTASCAGASLLCHSIHHLIVVYLPPYILSTEPSHTVLQLRCAIVNSVIVKTSSSGSERNHQIFQL